MANSASLNLKTFHRGVHPDEFKSISCTIPSRVLPLPDEVFIPLQQHIGAPCEALVEKGDLVKTGQKIADTKAFVSSPIHASISGKVMAVAAFPHPLGGKVPMIHIKRVGDEDDWQHLVIPDQWESSSREILQKIVREAGIVGLGGAAFPTHVKMAPPKDKPIDHFILNGCECEPFLTCDHRDMLENTDKILQGMAIMMKLLDIEQGTIGIESNKADAIEMMETRVQALNLNFTVQSLKVKYPQGAEKMLIDAALGRKVPAGGLPMDIGVVVNNVATALAIYEAVVEGKPLIQRMLTVTGDAVENPGNIIARIGTPFQVCVDACGGLKGDTAQVFMGGPMMGLAQYDLKVPTLKGTSGIVCLEASQLKSTRHYPCIQCGSCVSVCPMNLVPTRISRLAETAKYDDCKDWGVFNCIECGSCAFVCPSGIPLVQWIRVGKVKITEKQNKLKARA